MMIVIIIIMTTTMMMTMMATMTVTTMMTTLAGFLCVMVVQFAVNVPEHCNFWRLWLLETTVCDMGGKADSDHIVL